MFDSLLGRKFSNKCKHSVKCIKCRMETIRKKKLAMVKYLKKDVADLVSSGHDTNAFGRMDALLFEINQASCYDMIEQYCCCILEHLPAMQKERYCPEETVEAVATLIFAAARFSDLPELADLRRGFTERYRTNMESYTNTEFVEKMQQKSFSKDKKLQLMQDIAQEFMVDWDIKSFEYKISHPLAPTIDHPFLSSNITDGRREVTDTRNVVNGRKVILKNAEDATYLASEVKKQQIEIEKLKTVVINKDQKIIQMERDFHTTPKNADSHPHNSTEKIKKVAADESKNIEPHQFGKRTPYVKTKGNQNGNYVQDLICEGTSSFHDGFVNSTTEEVVKEMKHNCQPPQPNGGVNIESKRASNLKPPYVKPKVNSPLETSYVKPTNYEMYSGVDNGDDHKILDKFSRHYSMKGPRNEPWKARTGTREPQMKSIHDSRVPEQGIEDEQYYKLYDEHTQARTSSLPPTETFVRRHMRSVSIQPDLLRKS